jgi:hypothetical protein
MEKLILRAGSDMIVPRTRDINSRSASSTDMMTLPLRTDDFRKKAQRAGLRPGI